MAKGDHTDLFMIFKDSTGTRIPGESTADMTVTDDVSRELMKGFDRGYIFEITSFTLSADADDQTKDEIRHSIEKQAAKPAKGPTRPGTKPTPAMTLPQITKEVDDRYNKQNGPPVKEINFTRTVDSSSGAFLRNIVAGMGYQSAALIKRKATGGRTPTQHSVVGEVYLRVDFDTVLVTEVDWDNDDDEVKEDCKFICRKISIKYRPQLPDGSLGAVIPGEWEWKPPE
jgi:type VI protein secretion system component Hcp